MSSTFRKTRPHRRRRQQALDFVGHRAGRGGRGRAARADLSERAARGERPRAGGAARSAGAGAVRRLERRADRRSGGDDRSRIRRARFLRPRRRVRAGARAEQSLRGHVARGLSDRARRQRVLARRSDPGRDAAHGEARRREHRHAHVHRQPAGVSQLQRDGRGEGGARSLGALPGRRSRAARHPRERDFSGSDQDARGGRHLGVLEHPAGLSRSCAAPPQRGARRSGRCRGLPARPGLAWRDGRDPDGRLGVSRQRRRSRISAPSSPSIPSFARCRSLPTAAGSPRRARAGRTRSTASPDRARAPRARRASAGRGRPSTPPASFA